MPGISFPPYRCLASFLPVLIYEMGEFAIRISGPGLETSDLFTNMRFGVGVTSDGEEG